MPNRDKRKNQTSCSVHLPPRNLNQFLEKRWWEGRTEFEHQFEKLAEQDFGGVAEYKESEETCFASSKAGWQPAQASVLSGNESQEAERYSTLSVALTTTEQSCGS